MRGIRLIMAVAVGGLGVAAATAVGASGSSGPVRATVAASASSGQFTQVDPVLNDGTKAVLKALNQGLALVLGKKSSKGAGAGFKQQQQGWSQVKNAYDLGETQFANTANQASDQFMNATFSVSSSQALKRPLNGGVYSDPTVAGELINLLRLISGYQKKMSTAAAKWAQVKNTPAFNQAIASAASAGGKTTVASGLKGATQLIQTVAKAEVTLYEKVAVAEIEYEGAILDAQEATQEIDAAVAAFERAIEGGARRVTKGAPAGSNQTLTKTINTPAMMWNRVVNNETLSVVDSAPQQVDTVAAPPVTTTTTTTATTTIPRTTITITCPSPGSNLGWMEGQTMTVVGSVSPTVSGGTVTITYDSSSTDVPNTTATKTTAANGTFTDTEPAGGTSYETAQSIQATYAGVTSNSCAEELEGAG